MQRENIIRGPAIVTYNSVTYYSKDDIRVTTELETFDVESSMFGKVNERVRNRIARIRFTPAGKYLTGLWPYGSTSYGASIYGTADKDLVILPYDATQNMWTFKNAAITRLPDLFLSAAKTICGEVEFTALGAENTAPGTADSLVVRAANTFNDTSFAAADIITQPYSAAWGSTITGIETREGWTVDWDLSLDPVESDTYGIVDMTLGNIEVRARCEPLTITETELLAAIAVHKAMGALPSPANNLVITGTGVTVTIVNSIIKRVEPVFGRSANRVGILEFQALRTFTSGRPNALFTVA